MPSSDAVFDTEEFDRVYAAYADSKRQLNQSLLSQTSSSHCASGSNLPPRSGSSKASMMCLRCGMVTWLPTVVPRALATLLARSVLQMHNMQNFVGMAQHLISDANNWVAKGFDACSQDGGASTFLAGSEYVPRHLSG